MAVNDRSMLPAHTLAMTDMADLLQTEQAELDRVAAHIQDRAAQLHIHSATTEIPRLERIYGVPVNNTVPLEQRRQTLIIRKNMKQTNRPRDLQDIVRIMTGYDSDILEYFARYYFLVSVHVPPGAPTDQLASIIPVLHDIRPAHLLFGVEAAVETDNITSQFTVNVPVFGAATRIYNFGADIYFFDGRRKFDGTFPFLSQPTKCAHVVRINMSMSINNTQQLQAQLAKISAIKFNGGYTFDGGVKFAAEQEEEDL